MINRKGIENQVADHLSRLEDKSMEKFNDGVQIDDLFPEKRVLVAYDDLTPWFAEYVNYMVSDVVPLHLTTHWRYNFMFDVRKSFWDDLYLFHVCADGIICHCVPEVEMISILEVCHSSLVGGIIVESR